MGDELAIHFEASTVSLHEARAELETLQARDVTRRGRSMILKGVINGLLVEVPRLDGTNRSQEWKRHQLYAFGLKRFPKCSKELVSLGAEYALYYNAHQHLDPDQEL